MRKKRTLAHAANSSGELSDRADFCIADPFRQSFLLTSLHAPPKKWILDMHHLRMDFALPFELAEVMPLNSLFCTRIYLVLVLVLHIELEGEEEYFQGNISSQSSLLML